jgi:transcriptional regulator with XRE-family HTH domain
MASTVNLSDLGRRVRVARLARRMTLEDVVSRTEFTVSWLSKLENGLLSPSLEGLVRLADVLECGVDTLVAGLSVPPQYVVVKCGCGRIDQRHTSDGGIVAECLADQWRNRAMDPLILRVTAAGNRRHPDNHDGERFLLVLDGGVQVAYGDETIELAAGDSMYIYAAIPHTLHATGRGEAHVLSVSYDQPQAGRRAPRRN